MIKHIAWGLLLIPFIQAAYALPGPRIPVTSCDELQAMGADLDADYHLTQDIDCAGMVFIPIQGTFSGMLTGKNETGPAFTIRHLTIEALPGQSGGLFERVFEGILLDIVFEDVTVRSDNGTHRGLIAAHMELGMVENVTVNHLDVGGGTGVSGGLVGNAQFSVIVNTHINDVTVAQHTWTGGMLGEAYGVKIEKSSVTALHPGNLAVQQDAYPDNIGYGGFIGHAGGAVNITQSFATGTIVSPYNAGGLIGVATASEIRNSYAQVDLLGNTAYAGGVIGRILSQVVLEHVYAAGRIEADKYGRGMIGAENAQGDFPVTVTEGYFDKEVSKRDASGDGGSQGRSTEKMTKKHDETFASSKGWSRTIWQFETGQYPMLRR